MASKQGNFQVVKNTLLYGVGADTSIFRQLPMVIRLGRIGFRAAPFALPAAVAVAWFAYPALDPTWKKETGIP